MKGRRGPRRRSEELLGASSWMRANRRIGCSEWKHPQCGLGAASRHQIGQATSVRLTPMKGRIDPDIERILPLLPLKNATDLTPSRARSELIALAESRKDVPLPQPAAISDLNIPTPVGTVAARMYRPTKTPAATLLYFHGGGWVAGDLYTHDRLARTLAIELESVVVSV